MNHVKAYANTAIATPIRVAATRDGGFVVTNHESTKLGLVPFFLSTTRSSNSEYCSPNDCYIPASRGLAYPNGIVKGKDGLYYVPNVFVNKISVFKLQPDLMLKEGNIIRAGMPVDNRSVDRNEKIWTAAIPKPLDIDSASADPKFAF